MIRCVKLEEFVTRLESGDHKGLMVIDKVSHKSLARQFHVFKFVPTISSFKVGGFCKSYCNHAGGCRCGRYLIEGKRGKTEGWSIRLEFPEDTQLSRPLISKTISGSVRECLRFPVGGELVFKCTNSHGFEDRICFFPQEEARDWKK